MPDIAQRARASSLELLRVLGFVSLNAAIVGALAWVLCEALPPLRSEPPAAILLPVIVITGVASAVLHRVVRRLRSSVARALALYAAFFAGLVAFGVHLSIYQGSGSPEQWARLHRHWYDFVSLVPAALFFGHVLGLPVLFLVGAADKLLSPILTPRT